MNKKYTYFIVIFLIVASFIVYGRILNNGFVNLDDNQYITENNHIKSGINPESIKWAFTTTYFSYWHPLTWLSHMLDWSLFKNHAGGHHLINLLLHIGAALFLFFLLNKMTKNLWSSALVAALFALHPLRVESVAWAAECKDVLSMFFGLASIYAYACYAASSRLSQYFLCLILFSLSLMAKPLLVTLPFVLLLLDYWPLGRWQKEISAPVKSRGYLIGRLLWEKAPFIFLSTVVSIITIWAQSKNGAIVSMGHLSFPARVANAIISYVSYLGKTFRPLDLAVFYPYEYPFPLWQILASSFILIGITIVVIYALKKLPFLFVGWFWYLGTLIPVIGLVQVGGQAIADRHTYLPSIGIVIMLVWGIPSLINSEEIRKKVLFPVVIAVLSIMAFLTWKQCGYWKSSIALYSHTLQVTKDNALVHYNFGLALFEEGKTGEAIDHYNKAISLIPNYFLAYNNRGNAYAALGQYQRAIEDYNEAIRLQPDYALAYYNRGNAYNSFGQYQSVIDDLNKAIGLQPDYADAYNNRGIVYYNLGQYQRAIEDLNKAIELKPDYIPFYVNRRNVYAKFVQDQQAIKDQNGDIGLKPDSADAYNKRGVAYFMQGNNELGCRDIQKACALGDCKLLEFAKRKGTCR